MGRAPTLSLVRSTCHRIAVSDLRYCVKTVSSYHVLCDLAVELVI